MCVLHMCMAEGAIVGGCIRSHRVLLPVQGESNPRFPLYRQAPISGILLSWGAPDVEAPHAPQGCGIAAAMIPKAWVCMQSLGHGIMVIAIPKPQECMELSGPGVFYIFF